MESKILVEELNKEFNKNIKNDINIPIEQIAEMYYDVLSNYSTVIEDTTNSYRWYDEFQVIQKIGDKYFQYTWGRTNTENSLEDCGFSIKNSIKNMIEVKPYTETITVTKYASVYTNETEVNK